MIHIGDALKAHPPVLTPSKKTERGELLRFFATELGRDIRFIGVRCAHYSISDLYALKSGYADRTLRDGEVRARIYFWFMTKTSRKI